jgi:spermidine synthase
MEMVWFRHFTLLLGGFRAVFSLLLAVILIGIGVGSLVGGLVHQHTRRPAAWLMFVQSMFVATTLFGLTTTDAPGFATTVGRLVPLTNASTSRFALAAMELWLNLVPILLEVAVPALLMGFTFPLANAVIQDAEQSVGARAGMLYLSNTAGAVCGSLTAGFLLLPIVGIQNSATILMVASALAIGPLYLVVVNASPRRERPLAFAPLGASILITAVALVMWTRLPSTFLIARAQMPLTQGERLLALSEGVNEVIAVTEVPDEGRQLMTNGHPMSSTNRMSRRYMRALAHVPLLSLNRPPESILVIGFGVGETLHAATLHPSLKRIDLADLSTGILDHAGYFRETNHDALTDPRVRVYINDGREHLRMQPERTYDVVALEPPPITHAGVGALYSHEFYALARSRLKPGGYISQWLPAYQVSAPTALAMVRAFVNVFPESVLLSGADAELILLGANDRRIEIDPGQVTSKLAAAPAVEADLQRLDMGSAREIIGSFLGAPQTLADATRDIVPVTDDRPLQEYGVQSLLSAVRGGVPAPLVDVARLADWCPRCFAGDARRTTVDGLDEYLALLDRAYKGGAPASESPNPRIDERTARMVQNSAYLQTVVPGAHALLGRALASDGSLDAAATQLHMAVRLDPSDVQARADLAGVLIQTRQFDAAADELRAATHLMPASSELHNKLGVALASQNKIDEAVDEFERALKLRPEFAEARTNLTQALEARRQLESRH